MVELVATGRRPSEQAKEFGCHETSILSWIRRAAASVESSASVAPGLHVNERAELLALNPENRQIKLEAWYNPHRRHLSLRQISPINF